MVVDCYAAESVVNLVAGLVDQGYEDFAVEAAISKVLATEALWRTADEALQIAGGDGLHARAPVRARAARQPASTGSSRARTRSCGSSSRSPR